MSSYIYGPICICICMYPPARGGTRDDTSESRYAKQKAITRPHTANPTRSRSSSRLRLRWYAVVPPRRRSVCVRHPRVGVREFACFCARVRARAKKRARERGRTSEGTRGNHTGQLYKIVPTCRQKRSAFRLRHSLACAREVIYSVTATIAFER